MMRVCSGGGDTRTRFTPKITRSSLFPGDDDEAIAISRGSGTGEFVVVVVVVVTGGVLVGRRGGGGGISSPHIAGSFPGCSFLIVGVLVVLVAGLAARGFL